MDALFHEMVMLSLILSKEFFAKIVGCDLRDCEAQSITLTISGSIARPSYNLAEMSEANRL